MKRYIKPIIKTIWGTKSNISLKLSLSFLITGVFCFIFAIISLKKPNSQVNNVFSFISGVLFAGWLASLKDDNSMLEFIIEFIRLVIFSIILIFSLKFCIISSVDYYGFHLVLYSIISSIGILFCFFYFISKFIDIFNFLKNIFNKIRRQLFNSIQDETSKAKVLIENITALLVSIVGLAVAIKTIMEPLINFFK